MLRILPAPFVCTPPYFSSKQWDPENSDVRLRHGEEREGATIRQPFFSDTEATLYVVNRGAKCLRSSAIEFSQLPNETSYVQCKCRAEEQRFSLAIFSD